MPSYYKGKDGAAAVPVQTRTRQRDPLATSYPMTEITSRLSPWESATGSNATSARVAGILDGYQVVRLFSVLGRTP